jgi:integrase
LPTSIRLYDLRHTAATLLISDGVDARTVADRLGHSDVSLTLGTYTHVTDEMQARATQGMERILSEVKE